METAQSTQKHALHVKLAYIFWVQHALLRAQRPTLRLGTSFARSVIQIATHVHQLQLENVSNAMHSISS